MASQSTKTLYHIEQLQATPAVLYLNYNPFQNNFLGLGGGGGGGGGGVEGGAGGWTGGVSKN